jgi:hypothetical protein
MNQGDATSNGRAVLVLTPRNQDAELTASALEGAGIPARTCNDLIELTHRLGEETSGVAMKSVTPTIWSRPNSWLTKNVLTC